MMIRFGNDDCSGGKFNQCDNTAVVDQCGNRPAVTDQCERNAPLVCSQSGRDHAARAEFIASVETYLYNYLFYCLIFLVLYCYVLVTDIYDILNDPAVTNGPERIARRG